MEPTTGFHYHIMKSVSPQTQFIFHDATSLDATHCMLYPHSDPIDPTVLFLFLVCQLSATRLLLWLDDDHSFYVKALKSHILIQFTPRRKLIPFAVRRPFVMTCPFPRLSQTLDTSILINDDDILDRMVPLLPTVIPFLFFWIAWTIYRPLGSIMKKKGGAFAGTSSLNSDGVLSSELISCSTEPISANSIRMSRFGRSPCCRNV